MKSVKRLTGTIKQAGTPGQTEKGNTIYRWFCPGERYVVDFADDFGSEGWQQYDTDQDAHYFGVWVNPKTLQTLTYAEGDWSLVECADSAAYNREIRSMNAFYKDGFTCKTIDDNGALTTYTQDRQEFIITK